VFKNCVIIEGSAEGGFAYWIDMRGWLEVEGGLKKSFK
jgi:hypothetical protein